MNQRDKHILANLDFIAPSSIPSMQKTTTGTRSPTSARWRIAWAYEFHAMHEQAIAEFIETARIQNAAPERTSAFRRGYDSAGMKGYCRAWLESQRERIDRGRINLFYIAQVYAFMGDRDRLLHAFKEPAKIIL